MYVTSVRFKRSAGTPLEAGLMIEGRDQNLIVDLLGKVVGWPIWYSVNDHEMNITWEPGEFKERTTQPKKEGG